MNLITLINNHNLLELIPIIYEFKDKVKQHIIIADELDKIKAKKLKESIIKLNKNYENIIPIQVIVLDEDNKQDIINAQNNIPKKDLFLNGTNADNTLLVVFSGYMLNNNGSVISYDKFENNYNIITLNNLTNHKINHNLNLKDFFILANYKAEFDKTNFYNFADVRFLFKNTQKLYKVISLYRRGKINKIPNKYFNILKNLKMVVDNKIDKIYGFGYLFELFILDKLKEYNFDDITMNLVIKFTDEITNEFDIFAIKDNHIYVIECKLGGASEAEHVIYKLDSLIEHFGDDSKGMIINIQDSKIDNKPLRKLYSSIRTKRASFNNILVYNEYYFNEKIFQNSVSQFFNLIPNNIITDNKPIFLLGGKDLEMLEIKKILESQDAFYIDRCLSWGAKLSNYKDILNDEQKFYGVELLEDTRLPQNYISIDHHNTDQNKDSSIEQIAKLLNIKLNRFQTLVAINDKSYIKGMKEFGATEVEIDYIRQLDRKVQGVTQDDEDIAEESIKYINLKDNIIVIKTVLNRFSPIVDRLYGKNILIHNQSHINYYGKNIDKLVSFFSIEIEKGTAYYGGDFGFFGINTNKEKLKEQKKQILKLVR